MKHRSDKLKDLDRALWDIFVSLETMPDALAVIRAAAFIDDALKYLLESKFAPSPVSRELLRGTGPLNSFSARAQCALALSLIAKEDYHDIVMIRRLRNDCAHTFTHITLSEPAFSDRTRTLRGWLFWTDKNDQLDRERKPERSKERFLLTAAVLAKNIVSPIGATRTLNKEESRVFWQSIFANDRPTDASSEVES
jgi:hypothetical protein